MNLYEYVSKWDPVSLIEQGTANDEYDSEVFEIIFRYKEKLSEDAVAELVHRVFVERLGIDPEGFNNQCQVRARDLKEILDKTLDSNKV